MTALDAIFRFSMIQAGDHVLCALSGGPDSVCLTHFLASHAQRLGVTVSAAHFSHGLRPERAEAERALCQRLCDSLHIPLHCGSGDTPAFAKAKGMGEEEAARTLRRTFLQETADRIGASVIATGHNRQDSAETLLFHLVRGTGSTGLQGIPPKAGRWIRPLICAERQEIEAYNAEHGLETARDESNFTGGNVRARMRRELLPLLQQLNPQAVQHLAQTALDQWLRDEDVRCQAQRAFADFERTEEGLQLSIPALNALPEDVLVRALQLAQREVGGHMLERPHLEAIGSLCRQQKPSGQCFLPGSCMIRRNALLVLTALAPEYAPPEQHLTAGQAVSFGGWTVELQPGPAGTEGFSLPAADCEPFLTVRSRCTGDAVVMPYGTKTVKKLMIERKIPKDLRDRTPIICNNKRILAIAGVWTLPQRFPDGEPLFHIICRRKKK